MCGVLLAAILRHKLEGAIRDNTDALAQVLTKDREQGGIKDDERDIGSCGDLDFVGPLRFAERSKARPSPMQRATSFAAWRNSAVWAVSWDSW